MTLESLKLRGGRARGPTEPDFALFWAPVGALDDDAAPMDAERFDAIAKEDEKQSLRKKRKAANELKPNGNGCKQSGFCQQNGTETQTVQ